MLYRLIIASARIISGLMLLLALGSLPGAYYEYLRTIVCITSIFIAADSFVNKKYTWAWIFVGIGILFNPFYQIYLQKESWQIIDIISGVLFFASFTSESPNDHDHLWNKMRKNVKKIISRIARWIRTILKSIAKHGKKIILVIIGLLAIFCTLFMVVIFFSPPEVSSIGKISGSKVIVSGKAFSFASVQIYVNDKYLATANVKRDGTFTKDLEFNNEGKKVIKIKQSYLILSSVFCKAMETETDLTPPDSSTFQLKSDIPQSLDTKTLLLSANMNKDDTLLVNGKDYSPESNGILNANITLEEGNNTLSFKLIDKYDNVSSVFMEKTINVDTSKIEISESRICSFYVATRDVCINIGDWTGYLDQYNSVAITGKVGEKIKAITVDGKSISWDENRDVYSRISVYINGGLNKYKVVATDIDGETATGYISTTAEKNN